MNCEECHPEKWRPSAQDRLKRTAVAAFSAFKRACFSLTGQRLNYKVRISLFRTILRQDIAYFDGVNTGDLLSRLSYDVNNLTSPCNTVLSLASQNVVVIVGALIMCFYTCWRLAMVSFAVVMPITYLIKRYARWSQTLNREISAMLGLAATAANEALGNVRTVRATSSEETASGMDVPIARMVTPIASSSRPTMSPRSSKN